MIVSARQIAEWLDAPLHGNSEIQISDVAPLPEAAAHHLAYVDKPEGLKSIHDSQAGCLVVPEGSDLALLDGRTFILVEKPKSAFIDLMMKFRPPRQAPPAKVAIDAWIHPTARIGEGTFVGAHAYIDAEARIGERCVIHPGAYVGAGVRIGNDCTVHANSVIQPDCRLGDRVILHACTVIGTDGFGYEFENGAFTKTPHTGTVILEDDVEVGASSTIDRAMIGSTVIKQGTKIDNQVQIGHNCRIGQHNVIAGHVGLAGSVSSGDYVQFAGQSGIADHVHIGSGARIGAKAAVAQNVGEKLDVHGMPARPAREQIRILTAQSKLPEMRSQLKELTKQVAALTTAVESLTEQESESANKAA